MAASRWAAPGEIVNPDPRPAASKGIAASSRIRSQIMNRYEPKVPRAALGIAAVAMTVIALGMTIVVPATMGTGDPMAGSLAASKVAPAPVEVVIIPAQIDVVAVPGRELVSAQTRNVDPRCKQQEI
jgi:hypothetical protein